MKQRNSRAIKLLSVILTVLMLLTSLPLAVFASETMGEEGDYVVPISENAQVDAGNVKATTFTELADYLRKTESYVTPAYETYPSMEVGVSIYYSDDEGAVNVIRAEKNWHTNSKRDMIIYAVNYKGERIGTEDDVSIIKSYIDEGYVVLVADFNNNPLSGTPNIEHAAAELRLKYNGTATGMSVNGNFVYVLPSGYRLARDVWYWNSYYYSAVGSRASTLSRWNIDVGGTKATYKYTSDFTLTFDVQDSEGNVETKSYSYANGNVIGQIEYVQQATRKNGEALIWDVFLDIIYPSKPKKATSVYVMAATSPDRHSNTCNRDRCTFVGMAFEGYTVSTFDHVYTPMSRTEAFGYIDGYANAGHSTLRWSQAAIRCIRYYADEYGYDATKIGVGGISKATPPAGALSIVNNEQSPEYNLKSAAEKAVNTQYGTEHSYEGDIIDAEGNRITLQQPFLYYDVPYGPVYDENGNYQRDVYGNIVTYDYYGDDGVQYVRDAAEGSLINPVAGDKYEFEDGFRVATGVTIADNYRATIEARKASDTYTSKDGTVSYELTRSYGTEENGAIGNYNKHDTYYYYIDSDVTASYVSAGGGIDRYYSTGATGLANYKRVPMIICCGSFDPYGCFNHWYKIWDSFKAWEEKGGNPYIPNTMIDQGHIYPSGYDYAHGFRRHDMFLQFFNHYLNAETYNYADVVWMTPVDGTSVAKPSSKIQVKFYNKVDLASVEAGVVVKNSKGTVVTGTWEASEVDTLFTFTPTTGLEAGETYTVTATAGVVKATDGGYLPENETTTFTVTTVNSYAYPKDDTYTATGSIQGVKLQDVALQTNNVYKTALKIGTGTVKGTIYTTFDKAELVGKSALRFEAVYMSDPAGVDFDVYMVDNYGIDASTLCYSDVPAALAGGTKVATVSLDEYGYGSMDLTALGLSDSGDVTFVLKQNGGDSVMFESNESLERGVGIVAVGRTTEIKPVADTYVSESEPDTSFGDAAPLLLDGASGAQKYAFVSFDAAELVGRSSVILSVPMNTSNGMVSVYALDGYLVSDTLTWNSKPDLSGATLVDNAGVESDGALYVDLTKLEITGDYVTLVLVPELETVTFQNNFDGTFVYGSTETNHSYNDSFDFRTGGEPKSVTKTTDPTDSDNGVLGLNNGTTGNQGRVKLYNVWGTEDLTEDDIGAVYKFDFKLYLTEDYGDDKSITCSAMPEISWTSCAGTIQTVSVAEVGKWYDVSYEVTVTADMIDPENPALFTMEGEGVTGSWFYIDDLTVTRQSGNGSFSSAVALVAGTAERVVIAPESQIVVDKNNPTALSGNVTSLPISADGSKVSLITFDAEAIKGAAVVNLRLPSEGTDGFPISVYVIDGAADPASYNWNSYAAAEKSFLKRVSSENATVSIDVASALAKVSGGKITFALAHDGGYTYSNDFTGYTASRDTSSTVPTIENGAVTAWNTVQIANAAESTSKVLQYRSGYNGGADISDVTENGDTYMQISVRSGSGYQRYKFYNFLGDRNFTQDDLGKQYEISFDIWASDEWVTENETRHTVSYGLMNALTHTGADGISYSGTAMAGEGLSGGESEKSLTVTLTPQTVTDTVTVTQTMIDGQYGMISLSIKQDEAYTVYVDNFKSTEIYTAPEADELVLSSPAQGGAALVHTHVLQELPSLETLVDPSDDQSTLFYERCVCGEIGIDTYTHNHTAAEVVADKYLKTAATCTAKSVYYKSCADCGMRLDDTFEHAFADHTAGNTVNGVTYCSVCGQVESATVDARYSSDGGATWTYADLDAALTALEGTSGIIELLGDMSVSKEYTVPADTTVILRSDTRAREAFKMTRASSYKGRFLTISGTLTLENVTLDSVASINLAAIIQGGLVRVMGGGTLTLESGAILENVYNTSANNAFGGAIYICDGGTVTMNDGAIIRNCATRMGAGVYVGSRLTDDGGNGGTATFTMNGGLITGNRTGIQLNATFGDTYGSGPAVYLYSSKSVAYLNGGLITNNIAGRKADKWVSDGAVFNNDGNAKVYISGDIVIRDNLAWNSTNTAFVPSDIAAYIPGYLDTGYIFAADFSGMVGMHLAITDKGSAIADGYQIGTVSGTGTTGDAISGIIDLSSNRVAVINGTKVVIKPATAILTSEETDVTAEGFVERRYVSIDAALTDVRDGNTLTLLADGVMTKQYALPAGVSFTIEGDGHAIKRSGNYAMAMFRLGNSGNNLVIRDLTVDGGKITVASNSNAGAMFYVGDGATLIANGCLFKDSYLTPTTSGNFGGAVLIDNGGTFIMNDSTIENCQARSGGAVFLAESGSTASKYATFIMNGGKIANCRVGSDQAMGAAVYMGGYSKMEMHGGVITGNSATRYDWGGFLTNIKNPDGTDATILINKGKDEKTANPYIAVDITADGAIGFRSSSARLTVSGDAVIRGNTARSMYQNSSKQDTVESDIGFFKYSASCVTFDASFCGSVGINYPLSSYVTTATVKEGKTIPDTTSSYANFFNDEYITLTREPVADGAVKIASVSGAVTDGQILGNVFDNQTGRVAQVSGSSLVLVTADAATQTSPSAPNYTDEGYTFIKYADPILAISDAREGNLITLHEGFTITEPFAVTKSFTLDGEGNTIIRDTAFKNDAMFRVEGDGTEFTFKNITLDGANVNISSQYTGGTVWIGDGATATMESGAVIRNINSTAVFGGAAHVCPGGVFNMKGGIIQNITARGGGAVYLAEKDQDGNKTTAAWHPIFNMSGGIITGCRVEQNVSMGAAVMIRVYGEMNMSGGLITGNTTLRTHHGGMTRNLSGTSYTSGLLPWDQVCDGAIAVRAEYDTNTRLNISGDAIVRGNYAKNKLATGEEDDLVESDIGFFKGVKENIHIADDFTGSIGIFFSNSTYTLDYTVKEGQTLPSSKDGGFFDPDVLDVTYNYLEDGTKAVATLEGTFEDGQILGTVIDNTTGNKVGIANADGYVYWTTAEAQTDVDGIRTRYVDLDDAIATGETAILLKDASFDLAKVGDTASIAKNGYTATPVHGDNLTTIETESEKAISYTYDGLTFEGPVVTVTDYEAIQKAPAITGINLAVGSDLTLKFYARLDGDNTDAKLSVVMNAGEDNQKTALLEGTVYDAERGIYVFAFKGITPQCMGDLVSAQLMDGDVAIGNAITGYSVKTYLASVLELYSDNATVATLVSDMLVYGAAAQNYTGYKTDALVTDGFEGVAGYAPSTDEITDAEPMTLTANISDSVRIKNAGLEFSNVNRLKFTVLTDDLSKTTVTLNGETVALTAVTGAENTYTVFTSELSARQFDDVFTLVLTYEGESGTQTQTLTYSVNNYTYRVNSSASQTEVAKALASATYYYGASSEKYTG